MTRVDTAPGSSDNSQVDQRQTKDVAQDSVEQNNYFASPNAAQENDAESGAETHLTKGGSDNGQTSTRANIEAYSCNMCADNPPGVSPAHFTFEQSDSPHSEAMEQLSQPLPIGQPSIKDIGDDTTPNIVIFGETGVGKSSVINLIYGEKRAHISNDALGCTFQHEKHIVELHGMRCALWDTTGLDEGTKGTVPAELAEPYLKDLIDKLAHSGGIHLVIYCIRATRLTTALKRNYDLFYVNVCRKKVPVALVVTGLEHQEGGMETWWTENEAYLKRCRMKFDAHACVTTLNVEDSVIQERRSDSQKRLRDLVEEYARRRPWKIESSMMPLFSLILRGFSRGGPSTGKRTVRRVIIYDRNTPYETHTRTIGAQELEYDWVHFDTAFPPQNVDCGKPGMLVFYTSPLTSNISPEDLSSLQRFYDAAGGNMCPVIVVLRGCREDELARRCEEAIHSGQEDIRVRCIVDSSQKLDEAVDESCMEHAEGKSRLSLVSSGSVVGIVSIVWRKLVELFTVTW